MRRAIAIALCVARAAHAEPAKDANLRGMRALLARDYTAAAAAFHDAVTADPTFLVAHYNLASVSSIVGDLATVRTELELLRGSKDPAAAKMLAKARDGDPDFDFASTDPYVRAALGLPVYPSDANARLFERNAIWSTEGEGCDAPAATLKFSAKKAKFDYPIQATAFVCKAKPKVGKAAWSDGLSELFFNLQYPGLGDQPKLAWTTCPDSTVEGACFIANKRLFHRGIPHTAP